MAKVILFTDYGDDTTLQIVSNGSLFQLIVKSEHYTSVINLDEETAKKFSKHTRTVIAEVIANKKEAKNG